MILTDGGQPGAFQETTYLWKLLVVLDLIDVYVSMLYYLKIYFARVSFIFDK